MFKLRKFLTLVLMLFLMVGVGSSAWRMNPYTGRLDYYEPIGAGTLGGLGDVTLTSIAGGALLYRNAGNDAWINLPKGTNGHYLTLAAGVPSWAAISSTFLGLTDTPNAYTGKAGQFAVVNAGENAIEFFAGSAAGTTIVADGSGGWSKDENFRIVSGKVSAGGYEGTVIANTYIAGINQNLLTNSSPSFTDLTISTPSNIYGLSHDSFANWAANKHVVLPGTIANVLSDHTLLAHTALGLFDESSDVDHDLTTNYDGNQHIDHTAVTFGVSGLISGGGTLAANRTFTLTEATIESAIDTLGAVNFTGNVDFAEDITATWADAADHLHITQSAVAGIEDQALIKITDDRDGVTTDEPAESSLAIYPDGANTHAFYVATGWSTFGGDVLFQNDVEFLRDIAVTWDGTTDHVVIHQSAVAGIENQALILIQDDRVGATVDEAIEASLWIKGDSPSGFVLYVTDGQSQFDGDVIHTEDIFWTWANAADHMVITQSNVTGTAAQPLIFINDDRTGEYADSSGEATIHIDAAGAYALYVQTGQVDIDTATAIGGKLTAEGNIDGSAEAALILNYAVAQNVELFKEVEGNPIFKIWGWDTEDPQSASFWVDTSSHLRIASGAGEIYLNTNTNFDADTTQIENVFITWADANDRMRITQASAIGTENDPLIFIDDDRTGVTVDEAGEASLVIDAEGTYALSIIGGRVDIGAGSEGLEMNSSLRMQDEKLLIWGTGNDWYQMWTQNGAGDDIWVWQPVSAATAATSAIFMGTWKPIAMTDHDNYISPTFVFANMEGADSYDYAGVVIGERGQADVKVAHYFDFYAMTGSVDAAVDPTATEIAAIFRFGASGSATPDYATTPGDVLFEGSIEVDGDVFHEANICTKGYSRTRTLYWQDSFDHGSTAAKYGQDWNLTALNTQGAGANTIDTTPSRITLTTDNNAIGDNEGTRTESAVIERARQNRTQFGIDLGQTVNTQFYCGWNTSATNAMVAAADEYVIMFFDHSDNANWQIKVGDGATEDVFTSAIPADTDHICLEIWVETDGTVHLSLDHVEVDITGSVDNLMTANNHYVIVGQAQSVAGAAIIVAEIDFVENEKMKEH